ncbi:MAG: ABC transporter ATP-binding protein, partial [SAR324 cluster bacterium]|nr:ABC transporter ATP-binding protein [SAR324 cluster bacterium]
MNYIQLKDVSKYWGTTKAVENLNIEIKKGEFVIFLGPSGCGKSTTLRLIAGLEEVSSGQIEIDGTNVNNTDPANRNVSMVFQSYALFPHLNVAENIIFGLKVRKVEKNERNARLVKVAEIVGLEDLLKRKPSELSGGQRQRVALARAIISDNPICLMDEPLSNLDAKLRHQMRVEIRELQKKLGITMIYVTHDQTEAMSMADKIVLMNEGHIVQQGKPKELFENPSHMFTAKFLGNPPMNIIETEHDGESHFINHNGGKIDFRQDNKKDLVFGLRPEDIKVSDKGIKCNVNFLDYQGSETIINTTLGIHEINIKTDSKKTDDLNQE